MLGVVDGAGTHAAGMAALGAGWHSAEFDDLAIRPPAGRL